jgi:uncharacterized protein YecE (DUF72 family)
MRLIVGTSGYSYKEWKGTFYPAALSAAKMLSFYAQHFRSVEINNTYYRMPDAKMVAKWAAEVPDGFTFVLKAPLRITPMNKDARAQADVRLFLEVAGSLGSKLGPILFRPSSTKDVGKLRHFLRLIPADQKIVFELRHPSWEDDEVYGVLREHDAAVCVADTDETEDPDKLIVNTASWGYLRLRRTEYDSAALAAWRKRIESQPWSEAYVFFKHEDEGKGPLFARQFITS